MDIPLFKHVPGSPRYSPEPGAEYRRPGWERLLEGGAVAVLLAVYTTLALRGLHRSLWLDEAWVANSLRDSWTDMFWGGAWMQTSPPLFLVISRIAITLFGLSTETLRGIGQFFALVAGLAVYATARRIWIPLAPLACVAVLFPELAVEYFGGFKQYPGEAAAAAVVLWAALRYLDQPADQDGRAFALLAATLIGLLPMAYTMAFLAPGIVWVVFRRDGVKRAAMLALGFGAMLAVIEFAFIRPNLSPALWEYWRIVATDTASVMASPSMWALSATLVLALLRGFRNNNYALIACLLPCVLLVFAEQTGLYPMSARTRLFVRPCLVLGVAIMLRDLARNFFTARAAQSGADVTSAWGPFSRKAALVLTLFAIYFGARALRLNVSRPLEDYASVVQYLHQHVAPGEPVVINAGAREGMRLYFAIENWQPTDLRWGDTGWPCCPRGLKEAPHSASVASMRADLDRLIPATFSGRVWLVYANRKTHWNYTGLDEGAGWRQAMWDRGCPPEAYLDHFANVVISPQLCHTAEQR